MPSYKENKLKYYYSTPCEILTPALIDEFSLESKWQQVSSSLQVLF